jgi:NTP pyrophosphatase (non-canonical NTP hydrolase)
VKDAADAAAGIRRPKKPGWYNLPATFRLHCRDEILRHAHPFYRGVTTVFSMDIKALTEAMHRFVQSKGWYAKDSPRPQTPRNLAISLALEAAEVLEHFQWDDRADPDIKEELADTALYLLQLSSILGIDLEQAILEKLAANANRTWPAPPPAEKGSG